jgi:Zn-dependent protease with chaperone function
MLLALRPDLTKWRRRRSYRGLKRAAIWGVVVAALLGVLYVAFPILAEEAAQATPRRWEAPLGNSMREAFLSLSPTCHGSAGLAALTALISRLAPDEIEDPPLTLDVIDGSMVNAFALPGNHIVVFRGLIDKAESGDEVAGVLAHELAHLDLRHPLQGAIQQLGVGAALTLALGGSDVGNVGQILVGFTYTRRMEAAADARGVALLEAAGLRADGLASFFRKLKPEESQGILPDWLASHPGLAERIAATDRPATGMHALDTEEWRALKAVCAKDATGASTGDTDEESTAPDAGAGTSTTTAPSGSTTENAPASGGNAQQGKPRKSVP